MVLRIPAIDELDPWIQGAIRNALIESALANARALAYFFMPQPHDDDAHFSHYDSEWTHPISAITGRIIGAASEHLAHAKLGARQGEPHPGAWPTAELAVALTGAVADLFAGLDAASSAYEVGWFTPDPATTRDELQMLEVRSYPTPLSDHPNVAALTRALQGYLRKRDGPAAS